MITVNRDSNGKIWSHKRKIWLLETPKGRVRQEYLTVPVNEYGYLLDQIGEEDTAVERVSAKARTDFLIWRTVQERLDGKKPIIARV